MMLWTDLFYMIVITTFTGSVLTVAWLITSYLLDKTGYLNMSYRLGKVVVLFWIIPVMYYAIRMIDRLRFVWNGYAFDTSPLIINVTRAVAIVWITGLAVAIMIYVFKRFRILSIRKESFACNKEMNRIFCDIKEQMGLGKHKITLRQSYRTTTAYVTGIRRPCVVVNAEHFSEKEMRVVFAHELMHVVHNDICFRYLLAVASILNFFNPIVWIFCRRFIKYAEYACDYSVCMSENGLHEYYEIIFNIAVRNNNLYDMLENYELDLAIVDGAYDDPRFFSMLLDTDYLTCVMSVDNPLARKGAVTLAELRRQKMILRTPASATRTLFESALESNGESIQSFDVTLEVDNIATIKDLIRKDLGVSILPRSACLDELRKGKIAALPVENLSMVRETRIVYNKDFTHTDMLNEIIKTYGSTVMN